MRHRSLVHACTGVCTAMDRDSAEARLLSPVATSPKMIEKDAEDKYGARNDASSPRIPPRHRRKASLPGLKPRLSTLVRLGRFAGTFIVLIMLVMAGAICRLAGGKEMSAPDHKPGPWTQAAMERLGWKSGSDLVSSTYLSSRFCSSSDPTVRRIEERLANPPLPPYRMLAGTMERNEGKDLLEWLLYHISLGIDHFVLYDHDSDDNTVEKLLPFVELGWVTLIPFKEDSRWAQPRAFERFRDEWKEHAKWLFFFDIDEFVVQNSTALEEAQRDQVDFVDWFDRRYSQYGGVSFGRMSFTTNGHYTRPADGAMASYTVSRVIDRNFRAPKIASQARFMQKGGGDIHKQVYTDDMQLVDSLEHGGDDRLMAGGDYPVYLNHYWSKSWDECVGRIKQKAFPGSWREQMGLKFCLTEMPGTAEYAAVQHVEAAQLARFAPSIRLAVERFEKRYPPVDYNSLSVSILSLSGRSTKREDIAASGDVEAGSTLVIDSRGPPLGELEVMLVSREWKHYLPTYAAAGGGQLFDVPSDLVAQSAELVVRRTYAASPPPVRDPVSPCSIMGHTANQPDRKQLLELQEGVCKGVEPTSAYNLATATWPHPRLRDRTLFRQTIHVLPSTRPQTLPSLATTAASAAGGWHLEPFTSQAGPPAGDTSTRRYTPERCPSRFDVQYWSVCGSTADLEAEGIYRWTPAGTTSYRDFVLSAPEVSLCLLRGEGEPKEKLRILVVGDSVASHTYMTLGCLLDQAVPDLRADDHVRFRSFQYEMFDLVNSNLTESDWLQIFAWSADGQREDADDLPDVVVLNVGLWATTWASLASYELGLRLTARYLRSIVARSRSEGPGLRIIWRETTAVSPQEGQDPLYQINPRVEAFNEVAKKVLLDPRRDVASSWSWLNNALHGGDSSHGPGQGHGQLDSAIEWLPAYVMTRSRADKARDNAHMCPVVQGDLAEVAMRAICRPQEFGAVRK
ncbi:hypothetical protein BMF94_1523 [Rhodotorula taiwanensis]|uniref:Glycosyltransferase family 92 protein n=1 Tax=Rhodotorula taiwanensis TaxID=741276 RepID=A0A2S5BFB5_9BASI|nr:hypothetical protein BMF94_1523 [Rhodotorula taiwanensis]